MTDQQVKDLLQEAAASIDSAKNQAYTGIKAGDNVTVPVVVKTPKGVWIITPDGAVTYRRHSTLSKAIGDSIERKADFSMMAGAAGNTCPTCNGSGRI